MAVADADDVAGQREVGAAADVEADVELGDLDDRLLARDAVADDVVLAEGDLGELLDEERAVGAAGEQRLGGRRAQPKVAAAGGGAGGGAARDCRRRP